MEENKLFFRLHIPVWSEDQDQFEMVGVDQEDVLENLTGYNKDNEEVVWDIDIKTGVVQNWNGKEVGLYDKLCDSGTYELVYDNKVIHSIDGYVPDFCCIGEEGYGDYISMSVNSDGSINDWNYEKCTDKCLKFFGVITFEELDQCGGMIEYFKENFQFDEYDENKQVLCPNTILLSKDGEFIKLSELIEKFIGYERE